jgi:hypothetical protein
MIFAQNMEGTRSMVRTLSFLALAFALTFSLTGPRPVASAAERRAPAAQAGSNRLYLSAVIRYSNPSYISPFGVTMFDEISDRTGLSAMVTAGADWAMVNARWVDIEPTEGAAYDFSTIDARLTALASKGIRPLILFDHNPNWAMTRPGNEPQLIRWAIDESKVPRLVAVMQALAQRYNGNNGFPRVDYWAFYGEPDNIEAWGLRGAWPRPATCAPYPANCTFDNPTRYADILTLVSPVIKAANSNAKFMIGALAYESNVPNRFNFRFLEQVLARLATKPGGIRAYIDFVGFNFFPAISTVAPVFNTILDKAAHVRGVLAAAGVPTMPIIVLEMGVWSGYNGTSSPPPYPMDETRQAQFVIKEYPRGLAAGLTMMHYFQPFDVPNYFNWGLFRGWDNANSPKPAYTSYLVAARELANVVYTGAISGGGLEGYTFSREGGTVTVFWGTSGNVTRDFGASCMRTVTRTNQPAQVTDNGAGDGNPAAGTIRISAAANEPVFVSACTP